MDNDKLDELERVATAFRDDDQSFVWNHDDFCDGVLALITAARRPARPEREANENA